MTIQDLQNIIDKDTQTVIKQEEIYKKETKSIFNFFKAIRKGV